MRLPFARRKEREPGPVSMAEFFAAAAREVDEQIAAEPDWYRRLPYDGLGPEAARELEIERRALWRRVIHDAARGDISGLRWTTRGDAKVCDMCRELDQHIFTKGRLGELSRIAVHLGCRCELAPVR